MIKFKTPDYFLFSTFRFKIRNWITDLEFSIDRSWSGCVIHISIMSAVCYFNIEVWPCHIALYRYNNIHKNLSKKT